MRLRLHPEASLEGVEARIWIGEDDARQGMIFADALVATLQKIKKNPLIYRCFDGEFRRIQVAKFSYSVIFRITDCEIQVIAIMHQHRRPGYWKDRDESWRRGGRE
jgi:plasmid stabilization system protein ParE